MRAIGRTAKDRALPPRERRELRARLLEDAAGDDVLRLRRDAVKAARVLELLAQAEPTPGGTAAASRGFAVRPAALAGAAGFLAGLLLAVVLAHTVFASPYHCRSSGAGFTCARAGR